MNHHLFPVPPMSNLYIERLGITVVVPSASIIRLKLPGTVPANSIQLDVAESGNVSNYHVMGIAGGKRETDGPGVASPAGTDPLANGVERYLAVQLFKKKNVSRNIVVFS